MALRRLLSCLFLTPCILVSLASAQSDSHRIDLLLQLESEALAHYQRELAPAIRCDYADTRMRQTCNDMLSKLRDEAQRAKQRIGLCQKSDTRRSIDLFNAYVELHAVLEDIQVLAVEDEFNGNRNREALAGAYNNFIKLTGVWFPDEIRKNMRSR